MMRKGLAIFAMTVLVAGSAFGQVTNFNGTITLTDPSQDYITAAYLCYFGYTGAPPGFGGIDYDPQYDESQNMIETASVNYNSAHLPDPTTQFTLLAVYYNTVTQTYGLAVGMNATSANAAVDDPFSTVFSVGYYSGEESSLINSINNGDGSQLQSFVFDQESSESADSGLLAYYGTTENELVGFSNGQIIGTISASAVPEPASLALFALGALFLLRNAKRSSHKMHSGSGKSLGLPRQ
jgi:hypothetical protein